MTTGVSATEIFMSSVPYSATTKNCQEHSLRDLGSIQPLAPMILSAAASLYASLTRHLTGFFGAAAGPPSAVECASTFMMSIRLWTVRRVPRQPFLSDMRTSARQGRRERADLAARHAGASDYAWSEGFRSSVCLAHS
ncbi:hypothetical protein BDP55DRAFT_633862 [Colletotrichum godetiae]|uniref:Uncharacterized protein n=1 Tax=Colletotrichum godetiae TaxID=1209918 RepID=A0AAJ0AGQ5_9PEZI|nr:uncharacterized protein BDP55DRAFT_633862 [Colletotrichum godetiae]KAK1673586.1 hypothetical protein BDP55DRAFT_633862 [Colletotrichum godetiae]